MTRKHVQMVGTGEIAIHIITYHYSHIYIYIYTYSFINREKIRPCTRNRNLGLNQSISLPDLTYTHDEGVSKHEKMVSVGGEMEKCRLTRHSLLAK